MATNSFDTQLADSQATEVSPVSLKAFDFEAYEDYEHGLRERCRSFWASDSGVLVYRRMRVAEVFSWACRDMRLSLELQLGGLNKSMDYKGDVPNFLEPWYGIGVVASSFGPNYEWCDGLAPLMRPIFSSVEQASESRSVPVAETEVGKHVLAMIDFFLDETDHRLPMSLTDTQSPLNTACNLIGVGEFLMGMVTNPEAVRTFLCRLADLLVEFTKEQASRIGNVLTSPGHGFASSRDFQGMGMSDDNMLMVSPEMYLDCSAEAIGLAGRHFGGPAFHSCGNWSDRVNAIKQIKGLRMVDGAFSASTDPSPNMPERFAEAFAGTGIVVNARIVGSPDTVIDVVKRLWRPGMKLIVATYCATPAEQREAYDQVHAICTA